ncbi:predicted protein [Sclerotinia sclerotiorum 1980 UF-70]|uniref:Uncharacterized protein n=1 Tax=Sclerotinia sclerotiorum (strain ATCC 18683 / 1980 / Ss-1) TaxID=665079 RepID=A7EK57_SCLS1|nr:predicted protein [Sclerotinia sclerotiorum 1980 UF-70]EDO03223.1 predicted protein [Sclerotinia sclerotiorum 1980 UF-70]
MSFPSWIDIIALAGIEWHVSLYLRSLWMYSLVQLALLLGCTAALDDDLACLGSGEMIIVAQGRICILEWKSLA